MAEHALRNEADLASEWNERLQRGLKSKRFTSILLMGVFFLGAAIAGFFGLAMAAFSLVVVGLIFLARYFDANSHLHEVRRRSKTSLAPHLSVLQRKDQAISSDQGQPLPHG